jgi:hypothetical protein
MLPITLGATFGIVIAWGLGAYLIALRNEDWRSGR